jgi:histone H3/H4
MAKKAAKAAAKKAAAPAKKKACGCGEPLVVASKVKAYVRDKGMMTSSDALCALSEAVYKVLDGAIARAQQNKRSTVKPQDL